MMRRVNRPIAIVVLIHTTLTSCSRGGDIAGTGQRSASPAATAPAQTQAPPPASAQSIGGAAQPVGSPDEVVARAKQTTDTIPRAQYDLAAASDALGPGIEPAFHFVRDRIGFESYSGALRGASGTLTSRAGNALDRSLLVADILKRKGIRTRFAVGRLDPSHAERLIARLFGAANAGGTGAFTPSPAAFAFDPFLARVYTRAARDYTAIRAALGPTLPKGASVPREELLQEVSQHAWIQAELNGRWIDLDPSFPDAVPEKTFGTLERTVDVLPSELRQQVTVRVVAETLAGRAFERKTSLEVRLPADELIDRQIFLVHVPGDGKSGLEGAIGGATLGRDAWTPVLSIGGTLHGGEPIVMNDAAADAVRAQPPAGGLGSIFGQGGALASRAAPFLGEWLEFEILFPNGRRETISRALIDRGGEAWRQSGTFDAAALRPLARDAEGLLAPRQVHNIWLSAGRHDLADYADAAGDLAVWAKVHGDDDPPEDLPFADAVWPFALHNFAFFVLSDHAILPSLNDSAARRFYADSPRILIASAGPTIKNGTPAWRIEYDLRRDAIRGVARDASAEEGVVERKIWFGALEGALEHELGGRYTAGGRLKSGGLVSTSALLQAEGALALRPEDAGRTRSLFADPETAALASRDLKSGATLVAPRGVLRGGHRGWWAIAGPRADTRAILENGAGGFHDDLIRPPERQAPTRGGTKWDIGGNRASKYGRKQQQPQRGAWEYVAMIAFAVAAVAIGAFLIVQFYREVWAPVMATQVQDALRTGVTADQQRR
jgi:transglutaminase-like putative cysteine protease